MYSCCTAVRYIPHFSSCCHWVSWLLRLNSICSSSGQKAENIWNSPLCYGTTPSKDGCCWAGRRQTRSMVFHGRMRKMLGCLGILKWIHGAAIPMNHLCVLNIFKAVFPACFQKKKLILHPPSTWVIHSQSGGNMCVHYSFDLLRSIEEVKPQGWTRTP